MIALPTAALLLAAAAAVEDAGLPASLSVDERRVRIDDQVFDRDRLSVQWLPPAAPGDARPKGASGYASYGSQPWPKGVLRLAFEPAVGETQRALLLAACAEFARSADIACVALQPDPADPRRWVEPSGARAPVKRFDYLLIHGGAPPEATLPPERRPLPGTCNSTVGWTPHGGEMYLGSGCDSAGVILHELGHALGLMHEHQRPDRDLYIEVNWAAIAPEHGFAYMALSGPMVSTEYDFLSIMHYGPWVFAVGQEPVFRPKPQYASLEAAIGGMNELSDLDRAVLRKVYGAAANQ